LDEVRQQALAEAEKLNKDSKQRDSWSFLHRRLGVLVEIFGRLLNREVEANELLEKALALRHGMAGLRSPACLTLVETLQIYDPNDERIQAVLERAMMAAHNVQDPSFCARSTSRANAFAKFWWPAPLNLAVIDRFLHNPADLRFAALHHVAETYKHRSGEDAFPMDKLRNARTLADLADIYQRPLAEFQQFNPEWRVDQALPEPAVIHVPDPGLVPLLAARFAAELLVTPLLNPGERVTRIQALVPLATGNPTALDTVLSRLVLAAAMESVGSKELFADIGAGIQRFSQPATPA
jgi:hypothetical protein